MHQYVAAAAGLGPGQWLCEAVLLGRIAEIRPDGGVAHQLVRLYPGGEVSASMERSMLDEASRRAWLEWEWRQ